ncbi:hemoblobin-interacting domain-containing protein [Paenibacillus gorillae]|uniref:hemoblobin-interacting domain-containing protein n=1 Tax=Paenibacillus gorillae TaxID=1243662 RepID=UPI0004BA903C|nr:carbohydrate binding domain-containing protein [Paenibacillus gorillae]
MKWKKNATKKLGRKIGVFALCLTMLAGYIPAVQASSTTSGEPDVSLNGHWASAQISKWSSKGLVSSYPDGQFKPDKQITRAEFVKLVNTLFGFHTKGKEGASRFTDVGDEAWYGEQVDIGRQAGYIAGYPDGTFKPDQAIARQEAASIAAGLFHVKKTGESLNGFGDQAKVASFAREALAGLVSGGYMKGFTDGTIRPLQPITRAEAVVLLDRLAGEIYTGKGKFGDKAATLASAIINTTDVTLEQATINGDLILAPGIGEGDVTLKGIQAKGTVYVNGGGVNSVHVIDSNVNHIVIHRTDGPVRVVFSGDSSAGTLDIETNAVIEAGNDSDIGEVHNESGSATFNKESLKAGEKFEVKQGVPVRNQQGGGSGSGGSGTGSTPSPGASSTPSPSATSDPGTGPSPTPSASPSATPTPSPGGHEQDWDLVWSDEFDRSGSNLDSNGVDLDKWGYQLGTGSQYGLDGWGNQEQQYYRSENMLVEDGKLVITAKKEGFGGKDYTSGRIYTQPTFTKAYGKFEAKISMPVGNGLWPAFWMMPAESEYGVWATSGELDIMEAKGRLPGEVGGTIHYGRPWPGNKSTGATYHFKDGKNISEEHVYGVEWEPGEIRWYVDGEVYQTLNNWDGTGLDKPAKYAYPAPFDKPFYMILNLAVGGTFDNVAVDDSKIPAQMKVDYVRVYEKGTPYLNPTQEPVVEKEPLPQPHKEAIEGNYVHDVTYNEPFRIVANVGDQLNTEHWNFVHMPDFNGNGTVSVDTVNGQRFAKADISASGNAAHAVQLIQNVTVGKGRWYKLSFDAKASASRPVSAKIGGGENRSWTTYSDSISFNLTTEPQRYDMTFRMTENSDALARLEFNLGLNTNSVWIGGVKLEEIEPLDPFNEQLPKEPLAGNYIYNGTFDLGRMDRMTYWNFDVQAGASATASVDPVARELLAAITNGGNSADAIALSQPGLKLQANNAYKLTFKASADANRTIAVAIRKADGTDMAETTSVSLTPTAVEHEVQFTVGDAGDTNGKVVFLLGGNNANIRLDDIAMVNLTAAEAELPLTEQFPVKNGDFSNGKAGWTDFVLGRYENNSSSANFTTANDGMRIAIANEGTADFNVMLMQNDFQLREGKTYVVTVKAKSSVARETEIVIDDASYTKYISQKVQLTGDYQTFTYEFKPNADVLASFKLLLGKLSGANALGAHDVYIEQIRVEQKGAREKAFLLKNGSFTDGFEQWGKHVQGDYDGDSRAVIAAAGGALKAAVANTGANPWDIQLSQSGLELKSGKTYLVTFDARSTLARQIEVIAENGVYHRYLNQPVRIEETTNSYTFEFTMPQDDTAALKFLLGQPQDAGEKISAAHDLFIDNVRFELKGAKEAAGEKAATANQIRLTAPPALLEDADGNSIGETIAITFTDNTASQAWLAAITAVKINGALVDNGSYTASPGKIEFSPAVFPSAGDYNIVISAAGYELASVRQHIDAEKMWSLTWSDEFDNYDPSATVDTNGVNLDKWGYQLGTGSQYGLSDWGNGELQYYRPENLKVEDGKLTIAARKENFGGKGYTSGRLWTQPTFTQAYGKFEARMKLPEGQGLWPAFWMMPADSEYGGWASSGELDIMEAKGRLPEEVGGTIHFGKGAPNNRSTGKAFTFPDGGKISDFHTYGVEWEPGEIRWYVDGEVYQTVNNWHSWGADQPDKYAFPAPFDKPFYIILNLAVGGVYDGNRPPDDSKIPGEMVVDYVRAYELTGRPYKTPVEPSLDKEPMPADAKPAIDGNYIYDPAFVKGLKDIDTADKLLDSLYWNFLHTPAFGGAGSASIDGGFAKVDITSGGNAAHALQLIQYATLVKGHMYKLSFDAKASGDRSISVKLGGDDDNGWGAYTDNYNVPLTSVAGHYEYRFQMTADTDSTARLEFNLGGNTKSVWIGNVRLEEVDELVDLDAAKAPMGNGEHVYNGSFDLGTMDRMNYWKLEGADGFVDASRRQLEVQIPGSSADVNAVKLRQKGINLQQSDTYELTFWASAPSAGTVGVELRSKDGSSVYTSKTDIAIGTALAKHTVQFDMEDGVTDPESQLIFLLGGQAGVVVLDQISLIRLTDRNVDFSGIDLYPIQNGDFFDGLNHWETYTEGAASYSAAAGEANIQISNTGANTYSVMVSQSGLKLKEGLNYELSFDAKSTAARDILLTLENAGYQRYASSSYSIGQDVSHYMLKFRMPADDTLALKFQLGKTSNSPAGAHTITIDNVVLKVRNAPLLQAPTVVADKTDNKVGNAITIAYAGNSGWQQALTGIEIDGTALTIGDYEIEQNAVIIHSNVFSHDGNYEIHLKAAGYVDAVIRQAIYPSDGNLILNGDMSSGKSAWEYWTENPDYSEYTVEDGKARLDIHYHGGIHPEWNVPISWSTQFMQSGIKLEAGKAYELSFRAWSSVNRPIEVELTGYNNGEKAAFSLTGDESVVHKKTLIPQANTTLTVKYLLGNIIIGDQNVPNGSHTIYFDDVVLKEVPAGPAVAADTTDNKVGQNIELTFADQPAWRSAITAITVDGIAVDPGKRVIEPGKITLDGTLFTAVKSYSILIKANGYANTEVTQPIKTNASNVALNKTATASSNVQPAGNAVDGRGEGPGGTRWESATSDNQWIAVDLGRLYSLQSVVLSWEGAFGKAYKVQTSIAAQPEEGDWTDAYSESNGNGGLDNIPLAAAEARHVRILGQTRGTIYGYSLWELEVYGTPVGAPDPELLVPPAVTADTTDNKLGRPIELTFATDTAWEAAISKVRVNGTELFAGSDYSVAPGKITLSASRFNQSGSFTVTIEAEGYRAAEVVQVIAAEINLALNKAVTASSSNTNFDPNVMTDGNRQSRWEAKWEDNQGTPMNPEWIVVDLGSVQSLSKLVLVWETAYGKTIAIQVAQPGDDISPESAAWQTVATASRELQAEARTETIALDEGSAGRYIRIYITEKGFAPYGPSLYEIEAYS